MECPHKTWKHNKCARVCVCVCEWVRARVCVCEWVRARVCVWEWVRARVCVCLFLYTVGDLNLNTRRLMGTCVTGKQAYKSHRMKFFENLKMQNVSCEG